MLIFSFRARAGRLSFVDLFFPYIDVASHVFVVSLMTNVYFQKGQSPHVTLYVMSQHSGKPVAVYQHLYDVIHENKDL